MRISNIAELNVRPFSCFRIGKKCAILLMTFDNSVFFLFAKGSRTLRGISKHHVGMRRFVIIQCRKKRMLRCNARNAILNPTTAEGRREKKSYFELLSMPRREDHPQKSHCAIYRYGVNGSGRCGGYRFISTTTNCRRTQLAVYSCVLKFLIYAMFVRCKLVESWVIFTSQHI